MAPPPHSRAADLRTVQPGEDKVSGFVFKIQANMDPKHRDRIAFFRLSSGHLRRGMKLHHVREAKPFNLHNPMLFLARDRETAEEAWAGDIIGIPNHGNLRIGDTLTEGEELNFSGIPSFAPEYLNRMVAIDPLRAKHLGRALTQLAEEGVARVFRPHLGQDWIVGVIGPLQFDVIADRVRTEYEVDARLEATTLHTARWVEAADAQTMKAFAKANADAMADDHDGQPVFLVRNAWHLERAMEDYPEIRFLKTKEQTR
jgi:peptide chain release factor 3